MAKNVRTVGRVRGVAVLFAAVWMVSVLPAAAQRGEGSFDRTLGVGGAVDLSVQSGAGSIRVLPGAAGSVRVTARLRADHSWLGSGDVEQRIRRIEQNPPIEHKGDVIRIGYFADDDLPKHISISYDVTVPAATKLTARTGSGSIDVGAVQGPVDVKSGSGSVEVGRVAAAVVASSGSGSVRVDGAASLEAATGSGSIHAAGVAGAAKLTTGSGTITVAQTGPGDLTARAGSGGITATGLNGSASLESGSGSVRLEGRPAGPWSVRCGSGGITLTLPADASFDLDARTNSGSIDSDHPVTMTVTGAVSKRHVRGKVRSGGPLVHVHAASGSIRIR